MPIAPGSASLVIVDVLADLVLDVLSPSIEAVPDGEGDVVETETLALGTGWFVSCFWEFGIRIPIDKYLQPSLERAGSDTPVGLVVEDE